MQPYSGVVILKQNQFSISMHAAEMLHLAFCPLPTVIPDPLARESLHRQLYCGKAHVQSQSERANLDPHDIKNL